jgi:hypothetical protein
MAVAALIIERGAATVLIDYSSDLNLYCLLLLLLSRANKITPTQQ